MEGIGDGGRIRRRLLGEFGSCSLGGVAIRRRGVALKWKFD